MRVIELADAVWADQRGWGLRPLEAAGLAPDALGELHVVSMNPGAIRGNHLHERGTEWLLLCGGPVRVSWRPADRSEDRTRDFPGDEPVLLEFPAGVAHALRNDSGAVVHLIVASEEPDPPTRRADPPLLERTAPTGGT